MAREIRPSSRRPPPARRRLTLDDGHGAAERAAEQVALQSLIPRPGRLSGPLAGLGAVATAEQEAGRPAPGSVLRALSGPG